MKIAEQTHRAAFVRQQTSFTLRHLALSTLAATLLFFSSVLLLSEPAGAFETVTTEDSSPSAAISAAGAISPSDRATSSRPVMMGDPCLPLLKSLRSEPSSSEMNRDRRSADEENSVGFVFGIRFALDSPERNKRQARNDSVQLDVWQPGNRGSSEALAIAGYRHCKTEAALKALTEDWRWSR